MNKGEVRDFVYLTDREKEIINVLRANDTTLSDFIERKEEYIEELQEALHNSLFELEAIEYAAKECLKENKKVYENAPWTLEEIKKATYEERVTKIGGIKK